MGTKQTDPKARAKHRFSLVKAVTWAFIIVGSVALIASLVYVSPVLSFIGLGLIFWGALFFYIQPEEHIKRAILDATVIPSLVTLNQIIQELHYKGKAIYLPPKYFKDPEANKVYIPKQKGGELPEPELTLKQEKQLFFENPHGILLTPPGAQLSHLFEKQLDTNFTKNDLKYLTQNIPEVIIEDLEIAENIEIETENNRIKTKITNSTFKEAHKENNKLSNTHLYVGCPLSSAIACALAKATGKPITIENIESSEDGKIIETTYQILEAETRLTEMKTKVIPTTSTHLLLRKFSLSNLASLLLVAIGFIMLAHTAWITFYDVTVWSKDVVQIFLGSRTGEAISLGIGMKLIHHFLIGLASFVSGMLTYFRTRSRV